MILKYKKTWKKYREFKMVNIGILGAQDCGKTTVFAYFMDHLNLSGEKILSGAPGGEIKYATETVDFIRFTYKGFIHVLYGTGGHRRPVTDYYRNFVLRNADRFLCMFDLSESIDKQLDFYNNFEISSRNVLIFLNKYDLINPDNFSEFEDTISDYFKTNRKKTILNLLPTVGLENAQEEKFDQYNQNCLTGIFSLCENKKLEAFKVWEGQ